MVLLGCLFIVAAAAAAAAASPAAAVAFQKYHKKKSARFFRFNFPKDAEKLEMFQLLIEKVTNFFH